MNFNQLLHQRDALLRQARLANVAFTLQQLGGFAARFRRAGLRGPATLSAADPETERLWPALVAHESSPAVIEEHFTEEDFVELADLLHFADSSAPGPDHVFRFEELEGRFLLPLRQELERAGIALPPPDQVNASLPQSPAPGG